MNEHLEAQMEMLNIELDALEDADSDKRYNAARRAVFARWGEVIYWLEDDGEDEELNYCDLCGDEVYDDDGEYCEDCWEDLEAEEEATT